MSIATITLFGADADYTGSPLVTPKTNLTGLTGYKAVTFDVLNVNPKPMNVGNVTEYLNNFEFAINRYRFEYNLKTIPTAFGSGNFEDEFEIVQLLDKKFNWVDFNNYPYNLYASQGTNAMRINIKDWDFVDNPGSKYWEITLGDLKTNMART